MATRDNSTLQNRACVEEQKEKAPRYCISLGVGSRWCADGSRPTVFKLTPPHSGVCGCGKDFLDAAVVNKKDLLKTAKRYAGVKILFQLHLAEECSEALWEAVLLKRRIYIEVPSSHHFPAGPMKGFMSLLEYIEEVLRCKDIIVGIKNERPDIHKLIRTLNFLGFLAITEKDPMSPRNRDVYIYLRYTP